MDMLIVMFGPIAALFLLASIADAEDRTAPRVALIFTLLLLILTICSMVSYSRDPNNTTTIVCPILVKYNVPYWEDELNKCHELTGSDKFLDPETHEVHIELLQGGWHWGIYVTEGRHIKIVKKEKLQAEAGK